MAAADRKTKVERKDGGSRPGPWKELGLAIKELLQAGHGRAPRRKWEVKELCNELGRISDSAVRQWLRGKTRPDSTNLQALINLLSKGETPDFARETATRLWAIHDGLGEGLASSGDADDPPPLPPDDASKLRTTAEQLLDCVGLWRREEQGEEVWALQDSLEDFCAIIRAVPDEEPAAGIPRLARVQEELEVGIVPRRSERAQRCFEEVPVGGVAKLLRRLSEAMVKGTGSEAGHEVSGAELQHADHVELRRELMAEIARLLEVLASPRVEWSVSRVASAVGELRELRTILRRDPLSLVKLEEARGRIETLWHEVAILGRVVTLTRRVLGSHVSKLPPLAMFEERLKDGSFGPEMVVIPAGSFAMGCPEHDGDRPAEERPQRSVSVPRFALGRYPVTGEEFARYVEATGAVFPLGFESSRRRHPMTGVSWEAAKDFCAWLSGETGQSYRLPSEAEWEYACRAGTTTDVWWSGSSLEPVKVGREGRVGTTEVDDFPANPWKLNDMNGNVSEWCEDDWHDSYQGAPSDGSSWIESPRTDKRVLRGSSWGVIARNLSASRRFPSRPHEGSIYTGLRVARSLDV